MKYTQQLNKKEHKKSLADTPISRSGAYQNRPDRVKTYSLVYVYILQRKLKKSNY